MTNCLTARIHENERVAPRRKKTKLHQVESLKSHNTKNRTPDTKHDVLRNGDNRRAIIQGGGALGIGKIKQEVR